MDLIETVAGGAAGVAQNLVGFPLDLVKVKLQTASGSTSLARVVATVVREDGLLGLYRGVSSPMTGVVLLNALAFQSFGMAKRALGELPGFDLSVPRLFVAGGMAGAAIALAECPVDFLKTQMQLKRFDSLRQAVRTVVESRGSGGVYQGFWATILRNVPANACWYGTFEAVREMLRSERQRRSDVGFGGTLLAGGLAGVAYWTGVYPIDVLKTTVQGDHWDPKKRTYKGLLDAASQIRARHGLGGFYKGFSACLLRAVPASAATFATYSVVAKALQ